MNLIAEMLRAPIAQTRKRKIGIEIERLGMWSSGESLHYQPHAGRAGAGQLLKNLGESQGWPYIHGSSGFPIGLKCPLGKVSLEPGSQLEFSSEPQPDLFTLQETVKEFEREVSEITRPWGLKWLGIAVNPLAKVDDIDVIPSSRYDIMTEYLGTRGSLATSMMRLTTSVQINLDYFSEDEGMEMLRAALLASPISYALFANSPIAQGRVTPYLSYRGAIWRQTDSHRAGLLEEVFADGFNFDDYSELIWNRPLMFAQASEHDFIPAKGATLADIAAGKLPGVVANDENQLNAIRELFTEARLKPGYVEIRSVDGQRVQERYGATAFWTGLLYSAEGRKLVIETLGNTKQCDRDELMVAVLSDGLRTKCGDFKVLDIAEKLVDAAKAELIRRGLGEEKFLAPVEKNVADCLNPADRLLALYKGVWNGSMRELIDYCGEE